MAETTVQQVFRLHGQSIWYDNISRALLRSGELARLVSLGVRGVTSNPSIFQKAISTDPTYAEQLRTLAAEGRSVQEIYYAMALDDIRGACDVLRPVFDESRGRDGFVSVEVLPSLAAETDETLEEAVRLARAVGRPNVMIKIPGTEQGFPAVEEAIASGVSINITLLFSVEQYRRTAEAYLRGLERRLDAGQGVSGVASVASFFVSRVDTACDALLQAELASRHGTEAGEVRALLGKAGIANSKMAYQAYREIIGSERWKRLERAGARTQRLLWGSTSTKNPAYLDTMYVDGLIGKDTVNTVPPAALQAFLDHGRVASTLDAAVDQASGDLARLADVGIDLDGVCRKLLEEGVSAFAASMDSLLDGIEARRKELL
jgi:transaldolase